MKQGDIVFHIIMGIKMKIDEIDNIDKVKCSWFDEAYYMKVFNRSELVSIDDYKLMLIRENRDVKINRLIK